MKKYYPQQTIAESVSCSGVGVHSGKKTSIILKPAPENHGIRFRRIDLPSSPDIKALFKNVVDTNFATVLGEKDAIVSTIEHLMAAFIGLGIDNVLVEINAYEIPIMDGSAKEFTSSIKKAGIKKQNALKWYFVVKKLISIHEGDKYVLVTPYSSFKITCSIEFDHDLIGSQKISFDPALDSFEKKISQARTFGFVHELEYLKKMGLGRGGSLENVVVIDNNKVLNKKGLRYKDEFIRHKLLDCLGDFSLLGMPIKGYIRTHKSGHALNHAFINKFLSEKDSWETKPVIME